jgi:hypothetical protein
MLIELFEFVISPEDRIVNGAIYTPKYIREYIINEAINTQSSNSAILKYADISCGCGGFLFDLAKKIKSITKWSYEKIFKYNLFGIDIHLYSIIRTKLLLSLLALSEDEDKNEFDFNLYDCDTLSFEWSKVINNFTGFDIIVGNPPYVRFRNMNKKTKELLVKWDVCKTGLTDLYIPFFQIGIENLAKNGVLGYITMNSFFKSLNGRALRDYFQKKRLSMQIIDFGSEQIFKSKNTYTCICSIQNKNDLNIQYVNIKKVDLLNKHTFNRINYNKLNSTKGWNLSDNDIVNTIENIGIPFKNLYKIRHGIATLKNSVFIFKPVDEDEYYYYLQKDERYKIEKSICKNIINPNKLKSKNQIEKIQEKVIFPYNNEKKPKLLDENVLQNEYPFAYEYLKDKKTVLYQRDNGKGKYANWYAYGRTQSLGKIKNKLFFPKIANKSPNCIIKSDEELYFYNGQAIIGDTKEELQIVKKIMESKLFWYYITKTSKPYNSNYYSLQGGYINNFGIPVFTANDKEFIIQQTEKQLLDEFLEEKYQIRLPL